MLKVIEAFSGIGSQAKALNKLGLTYEVVSTIEWDINAIVAYDLIHNGAQDISSLENFNRKEIIEFLSQYMLSSNGKDPLTIKSFDRFNDETLGRIMLAIKRTRNLGSITQIKGLDIPNDIDLLTYSFPCQDLSTAGYWYGKNSGISRDVKNRSGMLWEIERILFEMKNEKRKLPKFLLMENVVNILNKTHIENFNEWMNQLKDLGYENKVYKLNSSNFGIPQNRTRVFMISVYVGDNNEKRKFVKNYLNENDLEKIKIRPLELSQFIKTDYSNKDYLREAIWTQPKDTPSRTRIYNDSKLLHDGEKTLEKIVSTITTKQDRFPNAGVINFTSNKTNARYRYLSPRECFLLMGFEESDFQILVDNNFHTSKSCNDKMFFNSNKFLRMAGNSIVVNVLESIFLLINELGLLLNEFE